MDIVIVSWNVRDEVLSALESIQLAGFGSSVVMVDNASEDGTADAIAERFPETVLVHNDVNVGFARAVNQAVAMGTAEFVLLLNPDSLLPAGALEGMISRIESLPRHAALAPRLVSSRGIPEHSVHLLPSLRISLLLAVGGQYLLPGGIRSRLLLEGSWQSDVEQDVPWAIAATLLVRRSVLDQVGPLEESYFVYAEDLDWCDRVGEAGLKIRFCPSVEVIHLGNRSGKQKFGEDRTAAYLGNTLEFARRRRGHLWAAAFFVINAAATVSRYGFWRLLSRVRPTPRRLAARAFWRAHARFYLHPSRRLGGFGEGGRR